MTGDGSDTTLTLSTAPVHENNVSVFFDGVYQSKSNYSISGTTLTFSTAPPSGVAVEAITATNTSITTATQLADADGDTLIQTEESSDEDVIRFDVGGTEYMTLTSNGKLNVTEISHISAGTLEIGNGDEKQIFDASAQTIDFQVADTERLSITASGVTFNGDTAAANALDDYEEGTFNPGASISGASGSITYNSTNDHLNYTKIGDMVHVQGSLQIASNSANGGRLNITGLPFTAASLDGLGGQTIFHIQISGGTGSQDSGYLASLAEGATQLQVQKYTGVGATNDSAVTMAADSFLLISGQYKAA